MDELREKAESELFRCTQVQLRNPTSEFEELKLENIKMKKFMATRVFEGKILFEHYNAWEMSIENDQDPHMRCSRCGIHMAIAGYFTTRLYQDGHYCDKCQHEKAEEGKQRSSSFSS